MAKRVFFLAKFFEKKEYADDFLQGKLFLKPLSYFKEIEGEDGRSDQDEGAIVRPLGDGIITLTATNKETGEVSEITLTKDDLAAPVSQYPEWCDRINLLCLYTGHSGDLQSVSVDNVNDFRKQLEIPEECVSFGEYAIIITNVPEFLRRIRVAAEQKGYQICGGLVTYYDPEAGTPPTRTNTETIFHKRKEYEYQSEFRIAVNANRNEPTSLNLSIGDISDIAFPMRTSEINRQMSFEVSPQ